MRILLLLSSMVMLALCAAERPWIVADDPAASAWSWTQVDTHHVRGTPVSQHGQALTVMVLAGKQSTSYDVALGRFCRNFQEAGLTVTWECFTFNRNADHAARLCQDILIQSPDLLFSVGSEALAAVHTHLKDSSIPIVTSTCKNPSKLGYAPADGSPAGGNIAFTSLNVPPTLQLRYLQAMLPTLRCLVICVNKQRELVMRAEVEPLLAACQAAGIKAVPLAIDGHTEPANQLQSLAPEALNSVRAIDPDLGFSAWWVTSCTALFDQVDTLRGLADMPVMSENPALVRASDAGQASAMAAIGIARRNNAHLAALYAIRILRGEISPGQLPLGVSDPPDLACNLARFRHHRVPLPFAHLEAASFLYDGSGTAVRLFGQNIGTGETAQ